MKRETRIVVGGALMALSLCMFCVNGAGLVWYLICLSVMLKAERVVNGGNDNATTDGTGNQ